MDVLRLIKHLPIDLGQGCYRHTTKAKLVAYRLAGQGDGRAALDLGCGDGFWSEQLRTRGWHVTQTNYRDARCPGALEVNAELPLPLPDRSFDLVWTLEVIEHVRNVQELVREIRRVLRPGGRLIATTPNSSFWLYNLLRPFGITPAQVQNPDHKQFFSVRDIRTLFPRAEVYGFFPYTLLKATIRRGIALLSPTFVILEQQRAIPPATPDSGRRLPITKPPTVRARIGAAPHPGGQPASDREAHQTGVINR